MLFHYLNCRRRFQPSPKIKTDKHFPVETVFPLVSAWQQNRTQKPRWKGIPEFWPRSPVKMMTVV
jgi:hypothetical protein